MRESEKNNNVLVIALYFIIKSERTMISVDKYTMITTTTTLLIVLNGSMSNL